MIGTQVVDAGVASLLVRMGWGIATMFLVAAVVFIGFWLLERAEKNRVKEALAKALNEAEHHRRYGQQQRTLRKRAELRVSELETLHAATQERGRLTVVK